MPLVDNSVLRFLGKRGFEIDEVKDSIVISGQTEIPILKSFVYILLGVPVLVFFSIRMVHLYYDGITIFEIFWFFTSIIIFIVWIKILLASVLQGRKKWIVLDKMGITGPDGKFYKSTDIQSLGVETKKLAGVLSAAYYDDRYRKTIYMIQRDILVPLISFETRKPNIELPIENLTYFIGNRLSLKLEMIEHDHDN